MKEDDDPFYVYSEIEWHHWVRQWMLKSRKLETLSPHRLHHVVWCFTIYLEYYGEDCVLHHMGQFFPKLECIVNRHGGIDAEWI